MAVADAGAQYVATRMGLKASSKTQSATPVAPEAKSEDGKVDSKAEEMEKAEGKDKA
jgi:hypothetical protein